MYVRMLCCQFALTISLKSGEKVPAVIRPTKLYGAECWAMRKKDGHLSNKTEMRMLRWIHGTSLKATSQDIQKRANVRPIVKRRLSWYGHIRRRDPEDITQQWY